MEQNKSSTPQRYKILKSIHNSNKVFLAEDTKLKREVVLKQIEKKNPHELERFRRELSFHAKLDHPYIVPVYDYYETKDEITIVIKYVEGGSLKEKLRLLNLETFLEIFKKILQALSYVHSEKIIHRDIKPSNILLDKENHPYLIDFGILKLLDSDLTDLTQVGVFIGTAIYAAPEQFLGGKITHVTDIYSLGMILYEKLSGEDFTNSTSFPDKTNPLSFTPKPFKLPKEYAYLESICLKMIEKNPEDRYQSCGEVLRDLNYSKKFFISNSNNKKEIFITSLLILLSVAILYLGYSFYSIKKQLSRVNLSRNVEKENHLATNENLTEKENKEDSSKPPTETSSNDSVNESKNEKNTSKPLLEDSSNNSKDSLTKEKKLEEVREQKTKPEISIPGQEEIQIFVTTREVNLREKPSQNSNKLKRLKKHVKVYGKKVEQKEIPQDAVQEFPWYYDTKRKGYLYGKYLKEKKER
ncbi:MAG: serine/threonine protein kinase [Leptospiraceae bacterium]|nr:serine/threonine protein kinase [Leptospiraceae bacterium]